MRFIARTARPSAARYRFALGLIAGSLLASCGAAPAVAPLPADLERRLRDSDPLHPGFESVYDQEGDLFEGLLAVDQFVYPHLDVDAARRAFERVCVEVRNILSPRDQRPKPEEWAAAFLKTLERRNFVYSIVPSRSPGEPGTEVVSHTLLRRRGCCGTFSLLCAAFLQRVGVEAWVVCLPDHCLVRVRNDSHWIDIESTDLESPIRSVSTLEPTGGEEMHYGRRLSSTQTLWHYFVDRLWCWVPWRVTDPYALRALQRAKEVLGSTCQAFETQERRRRAWMAGDGGR